MPRIKRSIAAMLAVLTFGSSLPLQAYADIVRTDEVIETSPTKAHIQSLLARSDVRAALAERGVDPAQVQKRVDALTDDEARQLAAQIDRMPAGGSDILGIAVAVFIILLITDILGFTRIFPFTRPIR